MENHHGTAGKPMLTILEKNEYVNILVVVTRYFGGILLGTGGLVKAYSDSTILALDNAEIKKIELGYEVNIEISYQEIEKIKYFCKINDINIKKEQYFENVNLILHISKNKIKLLEEYCNKNIQSSKMNILSENYIKY